MPCMTIFERQPLEYKKTVLLEDVFCVSVEAGCSFGWDRYSNHHIGIDVFGLSAPPAVKLNL